MMLRSIPLVCVAVVACAGAGASRGSSCAELDPQFLAAGPAYADCAVSRRAEPSKIPRIDLPGRTEGASGCYSAMFDVVVDTTGRLVESTAKLVRTNNTGYAEAVKRQFNEVRYTPAEKDGHRVQQLVHHRAMVAYMTMRAPAGSAPSRPSSATPPPTC